MKRIKKVIDSPFAFLLALIPILNLVFFALLLMFAEAKKLFMYMVGATVLSAIWFILSQRLFSYEYAPLAFYVFTVLLSAASIFLLRPEIKKEDSLPKSAKTRGIIAIAFMILTFVIGALIPKSLEIKESTSVMLQAIVENDEEAFQSVAYKDALTLTSVRRMLAENGIALQGSVQCTEAGKRSMMGDDTEICEFTYRIGTEYYDVSVTYEHHNGQEGISVITIRKL